MTWTKLLEVKRIMGVKSESSPYAHIAQVYAIGSDQGEDNPSPTPRVDCKIDGIKVAMFYVMLAPMLV